MEQHARVGVEQTTRASGSSDDRHQPIAKAARSADHSHTGLAPTWRLDSEMSLATLAPSTASPLPVVSQMVLPAQRSSSAPRRASPKPQQVLRRESEPHGPNLQVSSDATCALDYQYCGASAGEATAAPTYASPRRQQRRHTESRANSKACSRVAGAAAAAGTVDACRRLTERRVSTCCEPRSFCTGHVGWGSIGAMYMVHMVHVQRCKQLSEVQMPT